MNAIIVTPKKFPKPKKSKKKKIANTYIHQKQPKNIRSFPTDILAPKHLSNPQIVKNNKKIFLSHTQLINQKINNKHKKTLSTPKHLMSEKNNTLKTPNSLPNP